MDATEDEHVVFAGGKAGGQLTLRKRSGGADDSSHPLHETCMPSFSMYPLAASFTCSMERTTPRCTVSLFASLVSKCDHIALAVHVSRYLVFETSAYSESFTPSMPSRDAHG